MADIETLRAQIERLTKENADHISQNDALYEKFTKAEALLSEQDDWKKNATRLALENKQLRLKMDQTAKAKDDMAGRKDRFNTLLKYMSVQGFVREFRVRRDMRKIHSSVTKTLTQLMLEEQESSGSSLDAKTSGFFKDDDTFQSEIVSWVTASKALIRRKDRVGVNEVLDKLADVDQIIGVSVKEVQRQKDKYKLLSQSFYTDICRLQQTVLKKDKEIASLHSEGNLSQKTLVDFQRDIQTLTAELNYTKDQLSQSRDREKKALSRCHVLSQKLMDKQSELNLIDAERHKKQLLIPDTKARSASINHAPRRSIVRGSPGAPPSPRHGNHQRTNTGSSLHFPQSFVESAKVKNRRPLSPRTQHQPLTLHVSRHDENDNEEMNDGAKETKAEGKEQQDDDGKMPVIIVSPTSASSSSVQRKSPRKKRSPRKPRRPDLTPEQLLGFSSSITSPRKSPGLVGGDESKPAKQKRRNVYMSEGRTTPVPKIVIN